MMKNKILALIIITTILIGCDVDKDKKFGLKNIFFEDPEIPEIFFKVPYANISIDGNFSDWNEVEPFVTDPSDTDVPGHDISKLYIAQDDEYVYLRLDLYNGPPLSTVGYQFNTALGYSVQFNMYDMNAQLWDYDGSHQEPIASDIMAADQSRIEGRMKLSSMGIVKGTISSIGFNTIEFEFVGEPKNIEATESRTVEF